MKKLEIRTGKAATIRTLYLSAIETLVDFGVPEDQAKAIAKETLRKTFDI